MFSGLPVTKKRRPEIPAGRRCLCGYDTWRHNARHSRERVCRAVFVTCWRQCPCGYLDTASLFASEWGLVHFIPLFLLGVEPAGLQPSSLSHCVCTCVLAWINSFWLIKPVFDILVRFKVCLVSMSHLFSAIFLKKLFHDVAACATKCHC